MEKYPILENEMVVLSIIDILEYCDFKIYDTVSVLSISSLNAKMSFILCCNPSSTIFCLPLQHKN